jgi:hypothetical protein
MAFVDWLGMTRARIRRENEITCVVASEAKQSSLIWIASSLSLLAMTGPP